MKRKGRIILVTMLAVLFMASTVYAKGGSWYDHGIKQLWKQMCKLEKKVAKADYRSKISLHKAKKNAREIKKLKYSKRKGHRWGKKPGLDLDALKAELLAELKADEAFKAELRGEKGEKGDPGEPGEAGESGTFISHWESLSNYNHQRLNLSGVNLKGARILQSYLYDVDLSHANLKRAHLDGSYFNKYSYDSPGCDMSNADLTDATVVGADFTGCDFTGAVLEGVDMSTALSVSDAVWSNTICPDGSNSDDNGLSCEGHLSP